MKHPFAIVERSEVPTDREDRIRLLIERFDPTANRAFEPARWLVDEVPIEERRFPLTDEQAASIMCHTADCVRKAVGYGAWLGDLADTLVSVGQLEEATRDEWVETVYSETQNKVVHWEAVDAYPVGPIVDAHMAVDIDRARDIEVWLSDHYYYWVDTAARYAMGLSPDPDSLRFVA